MKSVPETFGSLVFDDRTMKARLSGEVYHAMKQTMKKGQPLDPKVANAVATSMRDWAVEHGATHFTHWFQPLTGVTAEKHDGFISPAPDGGVIMEFSGKELIRGEPDASSFPSGGLRATFEARGYTAWDPTSYAFIKGKVLCIPTAFCSYGGEALDKKTPLLRSMEALNREALRILRLFGNSDVTHVTCSVGPEQEYFLVDRELYKKRRDLIYTGRTLFGAKPPKGQELDDHYFGVIKPRVQAYMEDLNEELWKLGILAKTEHNEVAPCQHELAPIYSTTNIATDHNQLTMEIMQKVAEKHGLMCLLHEKPFAGVNGSGKHNNWSIATDTGVNLLSPGESPYENAQFLLFLIAVIEAVDEYADLLRASVATAGNDHRLGANEAPPAVVSIFLGDELTAVLDALEKEQPYAGTARPEMMLGVLTLPRFLRDTTDRNRTSPFAFTGNKFEFRMVGSSNSIACANIMLNSAVADTLGKFADELEKSADFDATLHTLLIGSLKAHKRILFNGNGYDEAWIKEAESRGLYNLPATPDCVPCYLSEKNVNLFTAHRVYSPAELHARYEIKLDTYNKVVKIEAQTMVNMVWKDILPAVSAYSASLADAALSKEALGAGVNTAFERTTASKLSELMRDTAERAEALRAANEKAKAEPDALVRARLYHDEVLAAMNRLRESVDAMEVLCDREVWPYPTYGDILFSVK